MWALSACSFDNKSTVTLGEHRKSYNCSTSSGGPTFLMRLMGAQPLHDDNSTPAFSIQVAAKRSAFRAASNTHRVNVGLC